MNRTRSLLSIALLTIATLPSVAHATLPTIHVTLQAKLNGGRGWGIENPGALGLPYGTNVVASDYFVANKLQALDASLRYTCDVAVVTNAGFDSGPLPIYDLTNCTSLAPNCSDGIKNQDETDVDCGGTVCPPCGDGATCNVASDCTSGHCQAATSPCSDGANRCIPTHFFDGVQDGPESDVDCGGPPYLIACATGQQCLSNCDCPDGDYCGRAQDVYARCFAQ